MKPNKSERHEFSSKEELALFVQPRPANRPLHDATDLEITSELQYRIVEAMRTQTDANYFLSYHRNGSTLLASAGREECMPTMRHVIMKALQSDRLFQAARDAGKLCEDNHG